MINSSGNFNMGEDWMKLGSTALENGNYGEAYRYFSEEVEKDPKNWMAIFLKGKSLAWQTKFGDKNINELTKAVEDSLKKIEEFYIDEQSKNEIIEMFARSIYELNQHFFEKGRKSIENFHKMNQLNYEIQDQIRQTEFYCYDNFNYVLRLLKDIDGEDINKVKHEIKKSLIWICHEIVKPRIRKGNLPGISVPVNIQIVFNFDQSREYIKCHDELIIEVRRVEPDFKKSSNNNFLAINRLKMSDDDWNDLDKFQQKLEKLQDEIDKENELKEQEYLQEKYWVEHPEEYKAYLLEEEEKKQQAMAEQKRKEVELAKQKRIEINEKLMLLEAQQKELNEKIDNLKFERSQLGLFAGKQKKELAAQVQKLTRTNTKLQNEINELQKQLKSVNLKLRD